MSSQLEVFMPARNIPPSLVAVPQYEVGVSGIREGGIMQSYRWP